MTKTKNSKYKTRFSVSDFDIRVSNFTDAI